MTARIGDFHPAGPTLCVVGSRAFVNPNAYAIALPHITFALEVVAPQLLISGGADGMDTFAEAVAQSTLMAFQKFEPKNRRWAPDGYEDRNQLMALSCTHLLAIRCAKATTYGSGWTADAADGLGRQVVRITIPAVGRTAQVEGMWSGSWHE